MTADTETPMSQGPSFTDVTAATDKPGDMANGWAVVLACSCMFVSLSVLAVFLSLNVAQSKEGNTGPSSPEAYIPGSPGGAPVGPVAPVYSPASFPATSPKPTSKPTTTTTTTKAPLVLTTAFACTISAEMPVDFVFPPDGMCEVIFFTGLYAYKKHLLNESLTPEVKAFAEHSKAHTNRTRYGMGFSILNLTEAVSLTEIDIYNTQVDPDSAKRLDYFAEHKCNNYAVYDIEGTSIFISTLGTGQAVEFFPEAKRLFEALLAYHRVNNQPVGFVAIGIIFQERRLTAQTDQFRQLMDTDVMLNDMKYWFVLTHYPFVEYLESKRCFVEPPQVLNRRQVPGRHEYAGVRMIDAWYNFYNFDHMPLRPFDKIKLTITVSLRPTFKVPKKLGDYAWFKECCVKEDNDTCTNFTVTKYYPPGFVRTASFDEIYSDPEYSKNIDCYQDEPDKGCKTYSVSKKMMITWDDIYSLRRKVCAAKANITGYLFGLAVYDIDHDDWDYRFPDNNPYGPYPKLRMLYQLHKYISTVFISTEQEQTCLTLEPQKISLEDFRKIKSWPVEGV